MNEHARYYIAQEPENDFIPRFETMFEQARVAYSKRFPDDSENETKQRWGMFCNAAAVRIRKSVLAEYPDAKPSRSAAWQKLIGGTIEEGVSENDLPGNAIEEFLQMTIRGEEFNCDSLDLSFAKNSFGTGHASCHRRPSIHVRRQIHRADL